MSTILILVVVLGLIIFVHEAGHYFAAKKLGASVEEFGFGFPPRIVGIKRKGTIYSINWIPFGGFVKIKGETGDHRADADSFSYQKIWKRAVILSSGVFMNFVLAVVLLSIGFFIGLPSVVTDDIPKDRMHDEKIQVLSVLEESPAFEAGFEVGDNILSIDGNEFPTVDDLIAYTTPRLNETVHIETSRGKEMIPYDLTLKDLQETGEAKMGAGLVETAIVSYPWYEAIYQGIKASISVTWQILMAFYELLKNLIVAQTVPADISGPIGIAVMTSRVAKLGFIYLLQFTALLSINLMILNFLPFPALDGGRVLFLLIEKLRGKPVGQKVESMIHTVGFFILIGLVVLVSVRDVSRFKDSIFGFMKNLIG
ncbi:RIP metalloprotease RseP [Patescibacteria group bacterium]|nr:RIP metalloprotease RseP [Patescibacteria group bacterium]